MENGYCKICLPNRTFILEIQTRKVLNEGNKNRKLKTSMATSIYWKLHDSKMIFHKKILLQTISIFSEAEVEAYNVNQVFDFYLYIGFFLISQLLFHVIRPNSNGFHFRRKVERIAEGVP